ncbi:xanthine/uracil/vitamin C permease [Fusobacterium sp. IOR10]|uniref:xanthine/uracil/vitamin C permease n=1 Tax=Fusobacterium sp. IOR10 TaxID=2665157 RepID=UPI0013D42651|nr:xanthine/uracil/vitamin C permease [Fusobacterium sp. IOR10]
MKSNSHIPFFKKGDIGGLTYIVTNNVINYLIVIATLSGVLEWPDEIVYGKVIPGMSIGLGLSCLYYVYMAMKLAKKEGRNDITALPSGVSTPAMFVILYGVIMPLNYSLNDPQLTWSAAVAACFIGGMVEFCGGFIGPWMKKNIPRAALLGTVAGIGFIWMATQGLFDIFSDPIIGLPIFIIAMIGLFGGYLFPKRIPPLVVAVLGGVVYAYCLGRTEIDFTGIGFYFPNPINTIQNLINGFAVVAPYLTIIIPIEIYNFVETMDNVEAANAAGDNYSVREAQFADGVCTMISAIFGGVVPNTVWLGHAGLKKADAGIGYSVVSGIILASSGIFGLFTFLSKMVPPAICGITYLWCAVIMVAQAFRVCKRKQFAAVVVSMIPPVADFLFTQVSGAMGVSNIWTEVTASGVNGYTPEVSKMLIDSGVMWHGIPEVKAGAIIIGIIVGTLTSCIIDRNLNKASITMFFAAGLSIFGFIHSSALGFYPNSQFFKAYVISAVLLYVLHLGSKTSWLQEQEDFDYV